MSKQLNGSTQGVAAGVPFVAVPPARARPDAPVVVLWHLLDPPRTAEALTAALPLHDVDAWRIYLGLPMTGTRLPQGGWPELGRLASADAVMKVHEPISRQAAEELPAALNALAQKLDWADRPALALVGGSLGSVVAQRALLETLPRADFQADSAVLVSPVCQLRSMVAAASKRFNVDYRWHDASKAVAEHLDFVARAQEFVAVGQPALRMIVGAEDDASGFRDPSSRLCNTLRAVYDDPSRVDMTIIDGMGHAIAEEPGTNPAPQTSYAVQVDRLVTDWFHRHLRGCRRCHDAHHGHYGRRIEYRSNHERNSSSRLPATVSR